MRCSSYCLGSLPSQPGSGPSARGQKRGVWVFVAYFPQEKVWGTGVWVCGWSFFGWCEWGVFYEAMFLVLGVC